jgi:hypothetical protein
MRGGRGFHTMDFIEHLSTDAALKEKIEAGQRAKEIQQLLTRPTGSTCRPRGQRP